MKELLRLSVEAGNGCLMAAEPAIVFRGTYAGRDIVGKNSTYCAETVDHRGYVPVEWWVMSKTVALNPELKEHEGVTVLRIAHTNGGGNGDGVHDGSDGGTDSGEKTPQPPKGIRFNDAVKIAGELLLGAYVSHWPLTKVLDIGGRPVTPRFLPGDDQAVQRQLLTTSGGDDAPSSSWRRNNGLQLPTQKPNARTPRHHAPSGVATKWRVWCKAASLDCLRKLPVASAPTTSAALTSRTP